jgi:hypothetical protein
MKTLIYDCEIAESPEVWGWKNYEKLGLTVIGAWWNYPFPRFEAFRCDRAGDFERFQELVYRADRIIGFNSLSFDDPLCRAHGISIKTTFDVLAETRALSGQPRHYVRGVTRRGYSLDRLARANFGKGKTGHGAEAPKLWQQGRRGEVIAYCLNDVRLTRDLYYLLQNDRLIDPTTLAGLGSYDFVARKIPAPFDAIAWACGLRQRNNGAWYGHRHQREHFDLLTRNRQYKKPKNPVPDFDIPF